MRRSLSVLLAAIPFIAGAQTTYNQTCATAIPLPVSNTNVQPEFMYIDSRQFPNAIPDPITACSGSGNRTIGWYSFTAIASKHWLRTEGSRLDGHTIEVLSGSCGSLSTLTCMAANSAYVPLTGLSVGTAYYVRVISSAPCEELNENCHMGLAVVSDPTNDDCSGAIELTVRGGSDAVWPATEMATLGATQSQVACSGDASADDDVWYRFTATAITHVFPTALLHVNAPVIEWFGGGCGALTSLACNAPRVTGLTVGQEYHIRIHSASTDPGEDLRIVGDVYAAAPNDECSGAVPIAVAESGEEPPSVEVSTWLGTSSTVPCDTRATDIWLSFVAPANKVTVVGTANQDVSVFSGTCGALSCVSNGSLNPYEIFNGLIAGDTYFLKIGDGSSPKNGSIRVFGPPSNDECATATPLSVLPTVDGDNFTHGFTCNATVSSASCGFTQPADVWYSFTATAARQLVYIETSIPNVDLQLEVLTGTCGALTNVLCTGVQYAATSLGGLVPGTTYFLRVFTGVGAAPSAFRIGVTAAMPNDDCDGALQLPVLAVEEIPQQPLVYPFAATDGVNTGCGFFRDLWYKFTPTTTEVTFLSAHQTGSSSGVYVELFSGGCGGLTSLSCLGNVSTAAAHAHYTGLTPGTEYLIRFASSATISMVPLIVEHPVNDEISGAFVPAVGSAFTQPLNAMSGYGATQSLPYICGFGSSADDDTWYRFTATATTHTIRAQQRNTLFAELTLFPPLLIEAFDTLTTDVAVLQAHNIGCGAGNAVLNGLTIGDDYWYRVFTPGNAAEELCMFATWLDGESNDEAEGAVSITYGDAFTHYFNTAGATQSLPGADCATDDFADDDIWFSFTATNAAARLVAGYHTADVVLELFSGSPGNLTSLLCSDNVLVLPALTSGQTYYARLYSEKNATPAEGRIGLFITPSLTANSCVDETCLGPVLLSNPSIEQGEHCTPGFLSIADSDGLGIPLAPGWPRDQFASSDSYSSCAPYTSQSEMPSYYDSPTLGRVLARSGKGMAGMIIRGTLGYQEYIQAPLSEPLVPGEPYLVSFSAVSAPRNEGNCNGLAAYLSTGPAPQGYSETINVEPQVISLDIIGQGPWTTVCGVVVPDEPWDHITLGAFFADRDEFTYEGDFYSSAYIYYFIDDVVVAHIEDAACITSIGNVPPLEADNAGKGDDLRMYPNPTSDRLNIVGDAGLFGKRSRIDVLNAIGELVHAEQVNSFGALQTTAFPGTLKAGLYVVRVCAEGGICRSARLIIER